MYPDTVEGAGIIFCFGVQLFQIFYLKESNQIADLNKVVELHHLERIAILMW